MYGRIVVPKFESPSAGIEWIRDKVQDIQNELKDGDRIAVRDVVEIVEKIQNLTEGIIEGIDNTTEALSVILTELENTQGDVDELQDRLRAVGNLPGCSLCPNQLHCLTEEP